MRVLIIDTVPFELNGISTMIMSYYKYFPQNEISCDFIINTTIDQKYMDRKLQEQVSQSLRTIPEQAVIK